MINLVLIYNFKHYLKIFIFSYNKKSDKLEMKGYTYIYIYTLYKHMMYSPIYR